MNEILISPQIAVTLVLAVFGGFFAFGRILLAQFERRLGEKFDASTKLHSQQVEVVSKEVSRAQGDISVIAQQMQDISKELPLQYVRREDWIRFSAGIDHKLDRLADLMSQNNNGTPRG